MTHDPATCPTCGQPLPSPAQPKGRPPKAREALMGEILARFHAAPFAAADVRRELGARPADASRALRALEAQGRAQLTDERRPGGHQLPPARLWVILPQT